MSKENKRERFMRMGQVVELMTMLSDDDVEWLREQAIDRLATRGAIELANKLADKELPT